MKKQNQELRSELNQEKEKTQQERQKSQRFKIRIRDLVSELDKRAVQLETISKERRVEKRDYLKLKKESEELQHEQAQEIAQLKEDLKILVTFQSI